MAAPNRSDRMRALKSAGSAIIDLTAPVFDHLQRMAEAAQTMHLADATATGVLSAADTEVLERLAVRAIRGVDLITGAGMAAIAEEHPEAGTMSWWILRGSEVTSKRHVLNPRSDSFYDFSHSRWFQIPADRGVATLIAPYVDSWGTDDLTITAAAPVPADRTGITTIVAADLDARAYLRNVEDLLRPSAPAVLVDSENRAVASTIPELETGVRLSTVASWTVEARVELLELGWSLALMSD